jgi:hypothetical protein
MHFVASANQSPREKGVVGDVGTLKRNQNFLVEYSTAIAIFIFELFLHGSDFFGRGSRVTLLYQSHNNISCANV